MRAACSRVSHRIRVRRGCSGWCGPKPDPVCVSTWCQARSDTTADRLGRWMMATRQGAWRSDSVGRGTARLLVAAPAMIGSFLLLLVVMGWAGPWEPLLLLAWLASAAAVFTPVGERMVVRWACGFVRPSPRQRAQLDPVWRQVLARCNVDPGDVDLYLQRARA